jgi:basic amino acid/polyamine antiporter, APA family
MEGPDEQLHRGFGLSTATFVVIASMVGTGILVSPGYMTVSLGNHTAIFGLWVLGGILAICGALCVAELAAALPCAGGEYVYLREAYGPMPAFLSGWTSFFLGFAAPLAVAGHVAALYLLAPFGVLGEGSSTNRIVQVAAAAVIILVTLPNLLGHRQSARAQNLTTIVKLVLFVAVLVAGFASGGGSLSSMGIGRPLRDVEVGTAATQLFYVMFAYSGWNAASYLAGEVRSPARTLPRALLLGTGAVTVLYLAMNALFAWAVPLTDVGFANAEQVPRIAVARLLGPGAARVFSAGVGLTFLATVNAFVVTGPRIYFAMARDGLFPSIAGRLSGRGRVPVNATLAQSGCAIVILLVTDFQSLYQYAAVGLSFFALLFVGAVYVLRRRRPDMARPFRVPGYPLVPAFFMLATLFVGVFAFVQWPTPSLLSVGSILAGVPAYHLWRWFQRAGTGPRSEGKDRPREA